MAQKSNPGAKRYPKTSDETKKRTPSSASSKTSPPPKNDKRKPKSRKSTKNTSLHPSRWKMVIVSVCLIAAFFLLFFDISRVQSNAMNPELWRNDVVLSWNPKFLSPHIEPGDIVLIRTEIDKWHGSDPNFLRCISSNNENVSFNQDELQINGVSIPRLSLTHSAIVRPEDEPNLWRETLPNGEQYRIMLPQHPLLGNLSGNVQLSQDTFFLAGDNRNASLDSRQKGAYSSSEIRGRALLILYTSKGDGIVGSWIKLI